MWMKDGRIGVGPPGTLAMEKMEEMSNGDRVEEKTQTMKENEGN